MSTDTFLKLEAVVAITSLSVSELYRRINAGTFPRAIVLGPRTKAWSGNEIRDWQDQMRETAPREGDDA